MNQLKCFDFQETGPSFFRSNKVIKVLAVVFLWIQCDWRISQTWLTLDGFIWLGNSDPCPVLSIFIIFSYHLVSRYLFFTCRSQSLGYPQRNVLYRLNMVRPSDSWAAGPGHGYLQPGNGGACRSLDVMWRWCHWSRLWNLNGKWMINGEIIGWNFFWWWMINMNLWGHLHWIGLFGNIYRECSIKYR